MDSLGRTGLFFVLFFFASVTNVSCQPGVFNVMNFGAKADGTTDDANAFLAAWTQACAATGNAKVLIPQGTYMAGIVEFKGPCKGSVELQLDGTVKAPVNMAGQKDWIVFSRMTGLVVSGNGAFDAQGALAWTQNQCSNREKGGQCKFPISIRFNFIIDGTITGISSVNSKFFHINLLGCKNIKFHGIKIIAPATSLNTDGIHIGRSDGVHISDSTIQTGDDCVSIGEGSSNVNVSGVTCGPGHGISIGSLGKNKNDEVVNGVTVKNCTFTNTDNGVRVKTWPDSQPGSASNFTFEDIVMNNVSNPVIIDQEYCPYNKCNKKKPSLIKISDVIFKNIRGTSATKETITLICSPGYPCQGVQLSDINLAYNGNDGAATSICTSVKPVVNQNVVPPTCV